MIQTMNPPYSAVHIVNFILSQSEHYPINPIKLQKLTYIFFGWCLALPQRYGSLSSLSNHLVSPRSTPLKIFSEDIEAWPLGPVIPSIYHQFKVYGENIIPYEDRADFSNDEDELRYRTTDPHIMNQEVTEGLALLWQEYKDAPSGHLVALTHEEGSPWRDTYDMYHRQKKIPTTLIRIYYKNLYREFSPAVRVEGRPSLL